MKKLQDLKNKLKELQDALDKAASDNSIRAVLLTGEGKAFCAGQDLS